MNNIKSKLRFMSFSSGSSGNCYYFGDDEKSILIDAGVSYKRLKQCFEKEHLSFDTVKGVLVTHNHMDHIKSLTKYCQKLQKPVWSSEMIHSALAHHTYTAQTIAAYRKVLVPEEWNDVGGIKVKFFIVPHDAIQTVGYFIDFDGFKIMLVTDCGRVVDDVIKYAQLADTVIIESNYDMDMLMSGPYTYDLKMRIVQGCGHISNDECAAAVCRFWHPELRHIFLCHLSENNNNHDLAYQATADALKHLGVTPNQTSVVCLPRRFPSEMFTLTEK